MSSASSPSPTLRDRQRMFTRQQLVDAAMQCFHEKGYVATTIDEIAARAGTGRPTFYSHFPNKEAVVEEIVAPMRLRSQQVLEAFLIDILTPESQLDLRAYVASQQEQSQDDEPAILIWAEAAATSQELQSPAATFAKTIVETVLRRIKGSEIDPGQTHRIQFTLLSMWGASERVRQAWRAGALPLDRDEFIESMTELYDGYIAQIRRIVDS